jgi:Protein of unknown function (DUF3443)/Bacterial Ig-like domain (group 2)
MKSNNVLLLLLIFLLLINCGCSSTSSNSAPPTLISLSVTPANPSIAFGMTEQFTARGTFSDSSTQDLTASVTWNSSTPSVAAISNVANFNGLATSLSTGFTGTTTITATLGSISHSTTLAVTAPTLVSIEVTPQNPTITSTSTLTTQQFTATGNYSDSSSQNITSSVIWASSAADVAVINASGLATAVSTATTATALIVARSGNVSGSAILSVTGGSTAVAINVQPVTVNGSLCSPNTTSLYLNKPCVSITVCTPGSTTACQTIKDILLDTGSYGLRIFQQAFQQTPTVNLTQVMSSSTGSLATCTQFADGSAEWGPVKIADVVLGNEPAVTVPIQVIDATFGTVPSSCSTLQLSPDTALFNGILGVGVFAQDCGQTCVDRPIGIYYSCNSAGCSPTTVLLSNQVTNPVVSLPTDSNGVIVQLPTVPLGGSLSANGILVFGIDTQTNNASTGAAMYDADDHGEIRTIQNGSLYASIVDSGSNGLFFTPPSSGQLPLCSNNSSWFCPESAVSLLPIIVTLSATNVGASGTPSNDIFFQIGDFDDLWSTTPNLAFSDVGGSTIESNLFDLGLPFYYGRNIYVGIEGANSNIGRGPYFAY